MFISKRGRSLIKVQINKGHLANITVIALGFAVFIASHISVNIRYSIENMTLKYCDNIVRLIASPVVNTVNKLLLLDEYQRNSVQMFAITQENSDLKVKIAEYDRLIMNNKEFYRAKNVINDSHFYKSIVQFLSYSNNNGSYILAKIIQKDGNINTIPKNSLVICDNGLVGKVMDYMNYEDGVIRIMTVFDEQFRVPVITTSSGNKHIAIGNGGSSLRLSYFLQEDSIMTGDKVYSTAMIDVHIPEVYIGDITHVTNTGAIITSPIALNNLNYLTVLSAKKY